MPITCKQMQGELRALGDRDIAAHSMRFFKTGKGEYGAGDRFLGIRVPVLRKQAKRFRDASLAHTTRLLHSSYHEERLCALLMLVDHYSRARNDTDRKAIVDTYLENTRHINNWDLVDCSAHKILGPWLETRNRRLLHRFAKSQDLWERRIAIMTTYHFIRLGDYHDTLALSDASGWIDLSLQPHGAGATIRLVISDDDFVPAVREVPVDQARRIWAEVLRRAPRPLDEA